MRLPPLLLLDSVGKVARIAQPRHYVGVVVELVVYGSHPQGRVVGEMLFHIIDGLPTGNDRSHMHALGGTLGKQCLVRQLHGTTGGQHGVGDDEYLAIETRRGNILDEDVEIEFVLVFTIRRYKSIFGIVETTEESLMERETGSQDRAVPSGVVTSFSE